jgi:hypothetical protein
MTTPKQIAWKLVRYSHKHPEAQISVFEIPQIPGYRRLSHANKGIDESFVTTVYAIPITLLNPYLAGGLFVDYLVRGRYHIVPPDHEVLGPENMAALTGQPATPENPTIANANSIGMPAETPAVTRIGAEVVEPDLHNVTAEQ